MLIGFPLHVTVETLNRHSNIYRALVINPGSSVYMDEERRWTCWPLPRFLQPEGFTTNA